MGGPALAEAGSEVTWAVRLLALADLETGLWGAGWIPSSGSGDGVLGVGAEAGSRPMVLRGHDQSAPWRVEGEGIELVLEGASEAVASDLAEPDQGFDQLCRVTGTIDAVRGDLDCLGWRGGRLRAPDAPRVASLRVLAGWFDPTDGFAVQALRPSRAKGQDQDEITAAEFDARRATPVEDPRLSTTYGASGDLLRAGVELWIEADEDSEELYPRRAIGEAIQPSVQWTVEGLALGAQPFRWYSGEREGAGVYLVGRYG